MYSSAQGETFTKIDHNRLTNLVLQSMEMLVSVDNRRVKLDIDIRYTENLKCLDSKCYLLSVCQR